MVNVVKSYCLALDISTTCTGVTLLDEQGNIHLITHIEFSKIKSDFLWEKVDFFKVKIKDIVGELNVSYIFIEEALQLFNKGMSTANVITKLAQFNALISYSCREIFKIDPMYISANLARKTCGIPLLKTKKAGKDQKKQTFEYMLKTDLKHMNFDKTKFDNYKSYVYDEVDSYVIAKSCYEKFVLPK